MSLQILTRCGRPRRTTRSQYNMSAVDLMRVLAMGGVATKRVTSKKVLVTDELAKFVSFASTRILSTLVERGYVKGRALDGDQFGTIEYTASADGCRAFINGNIF